MKKCLWPISPLVSREVHLSPPFLIYITISMCMYATPTPTYTLISLIAMQIDVAVLEVIFAFVIEFTCSFFNHSFGKLSRSLDKDYTLHLL